MNIIYIIKNVIVFVLLAVLNMVFLVIPFTKSKHPDIDKAINNALTDAKKFGWLEKRTHPHFGDYWYFRKITKEETSKVIFGYSLNDSLIALFTVSCGAFTIFDTGEVYMSYLVSDVMYDAILGHEFGHSKYHKGLKGTNTFGKLTLREIQADWNSYQYNPKNAFIMHTFAMGFIFHDRKNWGASLSLHWPRLLVLTIVKDIYKLLGKI